MPPVIPGRGRGNGKPKGDENQLGLFGGKFFQVLFDLVIGNFAGLLGLGKLFEGGQLVSMRWNQVDEMDEDLLELQDRTQKLEGVIGYGSAVMSSHQTPGSSFSVANFDTPYGPIEGCTYSTSTKRYTLGSKGLWDITAKTKWDILAFLDPGVEMKCVVRAPGGAVHFESAVEGTGSDRPTLLDSFRVVVPTSGYTVEVQARSDTAGRGLLGSSSASAFNVLKISNETS